jgi:hypothetical protein
MTPISVSANLNGQINVRGMCEGVLRVGRRNDNTIAYKVGQYLADPLLGICSWRKFWTDARLTDETGIGFGVRKAK